MTDLVSTSQFAPQVRLVDLESGTVLGATQGPSDVGHSAVLAPDILSARVTLTNTGVGQLEVVLNNQRFVDGQPVFPPWKYNDFSTARVRLEGGSALGGIRFGQLLRLDVRYGSGLWNKMIAVQVTDMNFTFSSPPGAQLRLVGEDYLSLLKVRPNEDRRNPDSFEEGIVEEVLDAVFTSPSRQPSYAADPEVRRRENRNQPMRSARHARSQTYLQFLQEMAERMDYEVFVRFRSQQAVSAGTDQIAESERNLNSELVLCFEPARSGTPPPSERHASLTDVGAEFHYELRWGRDLLEFTPTFKVFELPTGAEVAGTNHNRRARSTQRLSESEITELFAAELPLSPNYAELTMEHALEARRRYFTQTSEGGGNDQSAGGTNLDEPRQKLKARAMFAKKVREFLTATGRVMGTPGLRPGIYVDIAGLRPPFDGYYYVTQTVHSIDSGGYMTDFSLRRPGMLPPQHYLPPTTTATEVASP